jgi:hypothetical protein
VLLVGLGTPQNATAKSTPTTTRGVCNIKTVKYSNTATLYHNTGAARDHKNSAAEGPSQHVTSESLALLADVLLIPIITSRRITGVAVTCAATRLAAYHTRGLENRRAFVL